MKLKILHILINQLSPSLPISGLVTLEVDAHEPDPTEARALERGVPTPVLAVHCRKADLHPVRLRPRLHIRPLRHPPIKFHVRRTRLQPRRWDVRDPSLILTHHLLDVHTNFWYELFNFYRRTGDTMLQFKIHLWICFYKYNFNEIYYFCADESVFVFFTTHTTWELVFFSISSSLGLWLHRRLQACSYYMRVNFH